MGVAILQLYPVPQDKTPTQVIELLQERVLSLDGKPTLPFLVDCEVYYSQHPSLALAPSAPGQPPQPRVLNVIHNTEHPATVFSVAEGGSGRSVTFTCDTLYDLLLLKLSSVYSKRLRIESKGPRFEVGDFLVKLGTVSLAGSFRGTLSHQNYSGKRRRSKTFTFFVRILQESSLKWSIYRAICHPRVGAFCRSSFKVC